MRCFLKNSRKQLRPKQKAYILPISSIGRSKYYMPEKRMIGTKRKEERLRYLKNYWCEKAIKIPKVKLYTSLKPEYSCAIANFSIEGWKPEDIDSKLFEKRKIHTTTINWENVHGVRVTPH